MRNLKKKLVCWTTLKIWTWSVCWECWPSKELWIDNWPKQIPVPIIISKEESFALECWTWMPALQRNWLLEDIGLERNYASRGIRDTQLSRNWLLWIPHCKGTRSLWTSDFRGTRQCFHVNGRTKLAIKWQSLTSTPCYTLLCPASQHSADAGCSNSVGFCRLLHAVTIYFCIRESKWPISFRSQTMYTTQAGGRLCINESSMTNWVICGLEHQW